MARMRYGVYHELEDQADELIRQSLVGVTKHSEKSDLLTPWKMADRHRREVMVSSGTCEGQSHVFWSHHEEWPRARE